MREFFHKPVTFTSMMTESGSKHISLAAFKCQLDQLASQIYMRYS